MSCLKSLFGLNPNPEEGGGDGYVPGNFARRIAIPTKIIYEVKDFEKTYAGDKKVLVLCTQEKYFECTNGKKFSTGNNPYETAVPLFHLMKAGFEFDVATPTGEPAVIEQWSMPKDESVLNFFKTHEEKFKKPLSLKSLAPSLNGSSPYVAVFLPGGHGSMLGLPFDPNCGKVMRFVEETGRHMITVCHGPAMMIADDGSGKPNPYKGYKLCAFPDKIDAQSPSLGYLPGQLTWLQCEKLKEQGLEIVNSGAKGETYVDRKLYSGDSPMACDALGKMAAEAMLKEFA